MSAAVPFGWMVAINNVPAQLSAAILAVTQNKYLVLAIINIFLLVVGCFMETTAILLIAMPTLPAAHPPARASTRCISG